MYLSPLEVLRKRARERPMRGPHISDPRSLWDILAVLLAYVLLEYLMLQLTGELLIRQELVVVGTIVIVWVIWASLRVLDRSI